MPMAIVCKKPVTPGHRIDSYERSRGELFRRPMESGGEQKPHSSASAPPQKKD